MEEILSSYGDAKFTDVPLLVVTGTMYDGYGAIAKYGFAMFCGDRSQVEIQVVPETD